MFLKNPWKPTKLQSRSFKTSGPDCFLTLKVGLVNHWSLLRVVIIPELTSKKGFGWSHHRHLQIPRWEMCFVIPKVFLCSPQLLASSKFLSCNWHQIKILMKNPSFFQFFVASLTRSSIFYPRNLRNDELRPGIPPPPGERERRKSKPAMTNKGKATSPKTPSKGLGLSGWCTLNCRLFLGGWDAWFWLGCCWKWFGLLMFWVTCANLWLWLLWQMATGFYSGAYS